MLREDSWMERVGGRSRNTHFPVGEGFCWNYVRSVNELLDDRS
jgi:hypothetical protein